MNKPMILVVEDDAPVQNLITTTLETHNYRYITASNGKEAVMEAASHNPDIMLLDLGLPDMDGIHVIEKVRSWSNMPIIIISARTEDTDKIDALDSGADDYLTKPFSVEELLARLRVTQRRLNNIQSTQLSPVFKNGDLTIDYAAGVVKIDEEELHLTPIEYKLLCLLAKNVGKVLTHKYITMNVWGNAWETELGSLRVFMASLRKKLHDDTNETAFIQTRIGVGYRMIKVD
ncbi:MAG: response regulator transcription factor [Erysipelotrichaceae bacterium]|nr:response regulator transcription factor [Erysipelotrichaceae bacterium]